MGHFRANFAPKTAQVFSVRYVSMRLIPKKDSCTDGSILALLCAHQEYLLTPKLMSSQVVQSA